MTTFICAMPQKNKKSMIHNGWYQRGSDCNGTWIGWHALITWFHSKYN